jgi:hypothetical protein
VQTRINATNIWVTNAIPVNIFPKGLKTGNTLTKNAKYLRNMTTDTDKAGEMTDRVETGYM